MNDNLGTAASFIANLKYNMKHLYKVWHKEPYSWEIEIVTSTENQIYEAKATMRLYNYKKIVAKWDLGKQLKNKTEYNLISKEVNKYKEKIQPNIKITFNGK